MEHQIVDLRVTGANPVPGTILTKGDMSTPDDKKKRLVVPQTLKGFRDLMPKDMIARNAVVDKITKVYEKYGFAPLETPNWEHLTTLIGTGGDEANKNLFRMDLDGVSIAMRYDHTVPFARLIAQYPTELPLPFRRYAIGPVFRNDKPGTGRYRQFVQFDIDAAGSESVAVDAEIVAAMTEVMRAVGLAAGEFRIRINSRKLMNALLLSCSITVKEKQVEVLRTIDKLQKVGLEKVRKELGAGRIDESGDPIKGVGLSEATIDQVLAFIAQKSETRAEMVQKLEPLLQKSDITTQAIKEMLDLNEYLTSLGVADNEAMFDPSLMRGLDYYTGPVFEGEITTATEVGSVMGGGRYDGLVNRFLDQEVPATGASIGLDRFVDALQRAGKLQTAPTTTQVLIISLRGVPPAELLKVANSLRTEGIATEIFFGGNKAGFKDQLSVANVKQIPLAVILGEDELKAGTVSVKDLRVGLQARASVADREQFLKAGKSGQVTIPRTELVDTVKKML